MSSSPQKSPKKEEDEGAFEGWWVIILIVCLIFFIGLGVIFMRSKRTPPLMNNKGLMPQINNRR